MLLPTIFLICAVVGGTMLVVQFLLMLIGLGGEALDIDVPHDVAHDFGGDLGADFHGDVGADFHGDVAANVAHGSHAAPDHHVGSSWLFGVISLRTVIAALAFFGLAGLGARSAEIGPFGQLVAGVVVGLAAMYGVYFLMLSLGKLKSEGTPRIERTVGIHGTVYTTIPAEESGSGKIQLILQNQTMEYLAMTPGHALSPGAKVVVTDIVTSNTVQVEPVLEPEERTNDA